MMVLPQEIIDKILVYLPFTKVIYISDYASKIIFETRDINICNLALYGSLSSLKWLYKNNLLDRDASYIRSALSGYHLQLAKWLYEKVRIIPDFYCYKTAVVKNYIEALNWLKNIGIEGDDTFIDIAAEYGNLEALRWLHFNSWYGCTIDAMYYAAANGFLNCVKFLNNHRWENDIQGALEYASESGHFDIVKYLCENCECLDYDAAISYAERYVDDEYEKITKYLKMK